MRDFPEKVLFIDDDEEEQFIVTVALNECCQGIKLLYEKNANSALARMANDHASIPDMIIFNWRMPQINGKQGLIQIRKHSHYAQIPIVIFTGILEPVDLNEAKALGATFFLGKPLDFAELCQKLEYLFSLDWRDTKSGGLMI